MNIMVPQSEILKDKRAERLFCTCWLLKESQKRQVVLFTCNWDAHGVSWNRQGLRFKTKYKRTLHVILVLHKFCFPKIIP